MTVVRVRISRRDTADTAITAEPLDSSLHVQPFSLSPVTEVGTSSISKNIDINLFLNYNYIYTTR